jgi:hypothetical protein
MGCACTVLGGVGSKQTTIRVENAHKCTQITSPIRSSEGEKRLDEELSPAEKKLPQNKEHRAWLPGFEFAILGTSIGAPHGG